MHRSVWIGWEPREAAAYAVARHSIKARCEGRIVGDWTFGLLLSELKRLRLYRRPMSWRETVPGRPPQMWDDLSDAPMSTQFSNSRFLVPAMVQRASIRERQARWALFIDCDMLVRDNINRLFDECDPSKAVMVVKHDHNPANTVKMDGVQQTRYSRKNWSSVCAFNVDHPANEKLTLDLVNSAPGRDLHGFCWLPDDQIGELDPRWNYLVGHSPHCDNPGIVHFTDGIPPMAGFEHCEFADEWREELEAWAASEEWDAAT